jgi:hypothetical protein
MDLKALCEDAGLRGADAVTAVRAYAAAWPLTSAEAAALRGAPAAVRAATLAARYGSDGARVASIALEASR